MKKCIREDLAEVRSFITTDICSLHFCDNNIKENGSSSALFIFDLKGNMLIYTAIKVLIKYTNVLSMFLTHLPVTRRAPAGFSFIFLFL